MVTAVKKTNKKKPIEQETTGYHAKSRTDGWDQRICIFLDNVVIFSAYTNSLQCCAFNELSSFNFSRVAKVVYCKELQAAFNEYVKLINQENKGSYQIFILNKTLRKEKANQPEWFVECLENYPGAYALPWTKNYTHNPVNTEVRMYLLPTFMQ